MQIENQGRRHATVLAVVTALIGAISISTIAAAEVAPSQTEYVSHLEAICKPNALATQRTMKGIRGLVRAERLATAADKFSRATQYFDMTVREITAVTRPPADASRLAKWFGYLDRQELYLRMITVQLRAGHTIPAQRLTARFIHDGNLANNTVLAFGFNYCNFKFSRYG